MIPIDIVKDIYMNEYFPKYERGIPELSDLYSDLKDKYINLKMNYIQLRRDNHRLRKENEALLLRATESERMLNARIFAEVKQEPPDEKLMNREQIINEFLKRK